MRLAPIDRHHDSPRVPRAPVGFLESCRGPWFARNRFADTVQTEGFCPKALKSKLWLICLAPRAGFEPATIRLTVECSTAELPRNRRNLFATGAYNKAPEPCKGRNRPFRRDIRKRCKLPAPQGFCRPSRTVAESRSGDSPGDPGASARHEPSPKKTHSPMRLASAGFEPLR
jgi:hypothetical protein